MSVMPAAFGMLQNHTVFFVGVLAYYLVCGLRARAASGHA
jgi:hypothetical protein